MAVRLLVISHFARRSVHSKAITPYDAARVHARRRRRRKCYKYTKTFDTYTSRRLITQSTIEDGDLNYLYEPLLGCKRAVFCAKFEFRYSSLESQLIILETVVLL